MTIFTRRSFKVGLLVAGLVCLGTGTANARGTSDAAMTRVAQSHVAVRHEAVTPQFRIKRGPLGTVVDEVVHRLRELAPPHGMQPMAATQLPASTP